MGTDSLDSIMPLVDEEIESVTALRRRLHQLAEPAFCEKQTAAVVFDELSRLGLEVTEGIARTGVVADLFTGQPGHYVALRADMDALAVAESTGLAYESRNPGYAHSCGHDGHVATLIAAARVLVNLGDELPGRVRFIFQPAEETAEGAKAMIDAGVLQPEPPVAILGVHSWPGLPLGSVGCRSQTLLASCDVLNITVVGRGGHGAQPHCTRNPLTGMAALVETLGALTDSHRLVSLCTAEVGRKPNVVADQGWLSGTLRTLSTDIRDSIMKEIVSLAEEACSALDLQAKVSFGAHTPAVVIDERLYTLFRDVAGRLLGPENVVAFESSSMGSEDFGWYQQQVPGLMFRLGMGDGAPLHHGGFDFNDAALRTGTSVLAGLALTLCQDGIPQ